MKEKIDELLLKNTDALEMYLRDINESNIFHEANTLVECAKVLSEIKKELNE